MSAETPSVWTLRDQFTLELIMGGFTPGQLYQDTATGEPFECPDPSGMFGRPPGHTAGQLRTKARTLAVVDPEKLESASLDQLRDIARPYSERLGYGLPSMTYTNGARPLQWMTAVRDWIGDTRPTNSQSVLAVGFVLATYANSENGQSVYPAQTTVADATALHIKTVRRATTDLVEAGYLTHVQNRAHGLREYALTIPGDPDWQPPIEGDDTGDQADTGDTQTADDATPEPPQTGNDAPSGQTGNDARSETAQTGTQYPSDPQTGHQTGHQTGNDAPQPIDPVPSSVERLGGEYHPAREAIACPFDPNSTTETPKAGTYTERQYHDYITGKLKGRDRPTGPRLWQKAHDEDRHEFEDIIDGKAGTAHTEAAKRARATASRQAVAAIEDCGLCDTHGYLRDHDGPYRCDHATGQRPAGDPNTPTANATAELAKGWTL